MAPSRNRSERLSMTFTRLALVFRRLSSYTSLTGLRFATIATFREFCSSRVVLRKLDVAGVGEMWVRLGRHQSDMKTVKEIFGEESYRLPFDADLRVIVDAGANAGYSALWFATRYPKATIISIEPDPSNVEMIRKNTAHLPNVHVRQAALTGLPGRARLVDPGVGPWGLRLDFDNSGEGRTVTEVDCITMDGLINEFSLTRIDLLKIDIEGGELEVFRSADRWIDHVGIIAAELHDEFRAGCTRSFIEATSGFDKDFARGENHFAARS